MKRHASMVALSRDHHFGLLFCWKIRQGLKKQTTPERMRPYVKFFWDVHLRNHFEEEETLLFPLLHHSLVDQARAEHAEIRQLVEIIMLAQPLEGEQLNQLADMLDKHIRFEERVLFPHMERVLPEESLVELGRRMEEIHAVEERDDYPDEFWLGKNSPD